MANARTGRPLREDVLGQGADIGAILIAGLSIEGMRSPSRRRRHREARWVPPSRRERQGRRPQSVRAVRRLPTPADLRFRRLTVPGLEPGRSVSSYRIDPSVEKPADPERRLAGEFKFVVGPTRLRAGLRARRARAISASACGYRLGLWVRIGSTVPASERPPRAAGSRLLVRRSPSPNVYRSARRLLAEPDVTLHHVLSLGRRSGRGGGAYRATASSPTPPCVPRPIAS